MSNGVKRILQKLAIVALLVLVGYLLVRVGTVAYERYTLQLSIDKAKSQVEELQKSNEELKELLAQLGNQEFLTLTVKEKLNVKGPDEQVAIIKDTRSEQADTETGQEEREFWREWWDLFFAPR
jgi:cell division protein FtsB